MTKNINDTVSLWIDSNMFWWDVELVRVLFNSSVTAAILKTTVGLVHCEDKWSWVKETSGNFIVKSAYQLFTNLQQQQKGKCSSSRDNDTIWNMLWKIKVPNNVMVLA